MCALMCMPLPNLITKLMLKKEGRQEEREGGGRTEERKEIWIDVREMAWGNGMFALI